MKLEEIRQVARAHGLDPGKKGKYQLIRQIQFEEGNITCFGMADESGCMERNCRWYQDCQIYSMRLH